MASLAIDSLAVRGCNFVQRGKRPNLFVQRRVPMRQE